MRIPEWNADDADAADQRGSDKERIKKDASLPLPWSCLIRANPPNPRHPRSIPDNLTLHRTSPMTRFTLVLVTACLAGSPLRANTPICTGATGSGSRCCYAESLPGTQDARKKIGGEGWTRTNVDGVANRSMDPSATSPCWTALCRGKSNRRTAPLHPE